jgi:hypothetical protein
MLTKWRRLDVPSLSSGPASRPWSTSSPIRVEEVFVMKAFERIGVAALAATLSVGASRLCIPGVAAKSAIAEGHCDPQ